MIVRTAVQDDAAAIADVHVAAWRGEYSRLMSREIIERYDVPFRTGQWANRLGVGDWAILVSEEDDRITGFCSSGPCRDADAGEGWGEIMAIYVIPERWGRGHGRALLQQGLNRLAEAGFTCATLWVLEANGRARRFYEAAGFVADGTTRPHEASGLPLLRYSRPLAVRSA